MLTVLCSQRCYFILLKLLKDMKAYELKRGPQIVKETLKMLGKQIAFLRGYFIELEINEEIKQEALDIVRQYGLLPSDAIIAATCKHYNIDMIITLTMTSANTVAQSSSLAYTITKSIIVFSGGSSKAPQLVF